MGENKGTASHTNKLLDRAADLAEGIAANSDRVGRQTAAETARATQKDFVNSASANSAAGNVGSEAARVGGEVVKDLICELKPSEC